MMRGRRCSTGVIGKAAWQLYVCVCVFVCKYLGRVWGNAIRLLGHVQSIVSRSYDWLGLIGRDNRC